MASIITNASSYEITRIHADTSFSIFCSVMPETCLREMAYSRVRLQYSENRSERQ